MSRLKEDMKTYTFKMVVLGYYSVGKSSLVLKYVKGEFNPNEESTIGASFLTKTVFTQERGIKFEIWDTAGQERYNSLIPMYYRGAQVALIVYDITSVESFETAKRWVEELGFEKPREFIKVLVGNKSDLDSDRKVDYQQGKDYADSQGLLFFESSAKTGKNIAEIFSAIAERVPKEETKKKTKGFRLRDDYIKYLCC
ncbi:RAS-RELATED PROTEIN RAB5 [Encephalitozoon cuniculi GB-M1]|uniref:RAS-RELATED PROTEIN RAB5 n=2 Tax=Encephalitozoon cuniculi TaxID=6035 RepID=Q8SRC8_ENCCU|nr:Rab family GTPase VPS21 [Encephalitozoon cuniculi GB-M1]AGE95144.1 ras-related protein rab5 [Encephalitozoon cuniculi]KMV65601.1 Rab5-like GTPase [Encephalitozoon cuniculi EcunIII-L]UYI27003.1 Ras-related protein Rab-5A [Encephalitozoon cuniculi]CAD26378.3 RAS-RELATED PROTEIN RAB5 [Encephalitozoon cuniculi GB-M1]